MKHKTMTKEEIKKAIEKELNDYLLAENLSIDELVGFVEEAHKLLGECYDLI